MLLGVGPCWLYCKGKSTAQKFGHPPASLSFRILESCYELFSYGCPTLIGPPCQASEAEGGANFDSFTMLRPVYSRKSRPLNIQADAQRTCMKPPPPGYNIPFTKPESGPVVRREKLVDSFFRNY